MKILITGGLGYLGGRLADYLSKKNHNIVVATRTYAQTYEYLNNVAIYNIDWTNQSSINQACKGCDTVIHSAGMNADSCLSDPVNAIKFNGVATAKLLKSAILSGVNNFIYFSTAHVYSDNLSGFFNESSHVTNLHPYATSHKSGEDAVLYQSKKGKINGIVFRISNAFGAPLDPKIQCWSLLVNDLCRQAIISNKIKLKTNGMQFRNFISIHDLSKIVDFFVQHENNKFTDDLPIYNVGSETSITVYSMALKIASYYEEKYGKQIKIQKKISSNDKMSKQSSLVYSIDKLTKVIGRTFDNSKNEINYLLNFCDTHFNKRDQ